MKKNVGKNKENEKRNHQMQKRFGNRRITIKMNKKGYWWLAGIGCFFFLAFVLMFVYSEINEPNYELESYENSQKQNGEYCSSNYYDCEDFNSQKEAQRTFDGCGGTNNDVHWLDGDKDGIACESLT